jgi:tight adherence protein B
MILLGILGILIAMIPWWIRKLKEERKRLLLASQLRQSLQNMVHALRVGVGFLQSLEYTAREGAEPLASELQRLLQSVKVGQSISTALDELARRVPLKEMGWFVAAVQITQSTGGSLAEVLETLSNTLQEQQALREKVSALTAQGKASGVLLGALPFLVLGAISLVAPEMAQPMFTTAIGQGLLAGVMVSVVLGGFVIKKIVTVKVD